MSTWILGIALLSMVAAAPSSKYHVTVTMDKDINFGELHTYAWMPSWGTFNHSLDTHIVAAIDRELASLGMTRQVNQSSSDVLVTYGTVRRTNVDVSAKRMSEPGAYPEYPVGTLVVVMRQPSSRRELFRARATVPVDIDAAQLVEAIDAIVTRMFAHYPTRT
jgi:hypothetical protein